MPLIPNQLRGSPDVLRPNHRWLRQRFGALSVWAAFALVAVGLCAAAAINRGLTSLKWSKTRNCADACALAGCRELLTDHLLLPERDSLDFDVQRCRRRAVSLSHQYATDRGYDDGTVITPQHEIDVLQRIWSAADGRYVVLSDSIHPNAVRVRLWDWCFRHGARRRTRTGLSRLGRARVSCEATAWLHDRISGFRASPDVTIPIAPLAIPNDRQRRITGTWSSTDEGGIRDDYAWDSVSREVRRNPDGLAELALTLDREGSRAAPGHLVPVRICHCSHKHPFADRVRHGLRHADTTAAGLDVLCFPRADQSSDLDITDFDELEDVLYTLIGAKRIFPLVDLSTTPNVTLPAVVAARVLDVDRISRDQMQVLVQPTVMSTSSAVICRDQSVASNRYVCKVTLLR